MSAIDFSTLQSLGLTGAESDKDRKRDELGQAEFFELMIAQLNNQDPFEPMESGAFLGQIAQFGTVNGINELKKSFDGIASAMQSSQTLQAASLVDREVLVPVDMAVLQEESEIRGGVDLPKSVNNLTVGVYNEAGQLVRQINMGAQSSGLKTFHWDGIKDDGEPAVPGIYEFRAQAQLDGASAPPQVLLNARVDSVRLGQGPNSPVMLSIDGFGEIELAKVRRIG
ncbi:flagellar basal-body rod modification protein FlgD [Ectothiorhodospira magna]|uniref:Basal-body rod modification protein FlgD n=1 Tax=Ectothiorhodospira magna TaxID=867345 RepID=A0A1H9DEA5_9GAMM|nr:flagellar hook assembly protein FlgD [Ectothiorhodospira magna]SEQ11794.1 flagellar basal-body rod modification protein FlgD [Ectothiorhodospira magna]